MPRINHEIGKPLENRLLVTGQETSYHAGDDGALQRGDSRRFIVLDTGQHSGSTDITINGKTHSTLNVCVKDTKTGLYWLQEVIQADIGPDNNGNLYWIDAANGEDIWSLRTQARVKLLGGYNDWEIPNMKEQASLTDCEEVNPGINQTYFPLTPVAWFWTSTTNKGSTSEARRIYSYAGNIGSTTKATAKSYCRLVRG